MKPHVVAWEIEGVPMQAVCENYETAAMIAVSIACLFRIRVDVYLHGKLKSTHFYNGLTKFGNNNHEH